MLFVCYWLLLVVGCLLLSCFAFCVCCVLAVACGLSVVVRCLLVVCCGALCAVAC